jgi:hypothetical protein
VDGYPKIDHPRHMLHAREKKSIKANVILYLSPFGLLKLLW